MRVGDGQRGMMPQNAGTALGYPGAMRRFACDNIEEAWR